MTPWILWMSVPTDLGGGQWCFGKSFDTFTPLGPVIATKAEIPDPQVLNVKTTIDGEVLQDSNTDDMVFTCAKIISFLSQDTTLLPGTVILTVRSLNSPLHIAVDYMDQYCL